jgi:uncharacterized protein YunC (DUF1805 family)
LQRITPFGAIKRRLRDVEVAALDELGHLAVEEGQEQGANVAAVHIGIGHDDDLVIAQFFDIELLAADTGAKRGDKRADLLR